LNQLNSNQAKSNKKKTKSEELNSNQTKSTKKKTKSEEKGTVISNTSFIVLLFLNSEQASDRGSMVGHLSRRIGAEK